MKKITYVLAVMLAIAFSWQGTAQTFPGATGNVPDNACPTETNFIATVAGVGVLGTTNQFDQVEITINHTWGSDLNVYLSAPDGTQVALTLGNGGSGTQYVNTIFRADAAASITTGSGDFTGIWLPEGDFAFFDGILADGDWTLDVCDSAGGDTGTVNLFEITFITIPSCIVPSALTVSGITEIAASIDWTENNGSTSWNYELVDITMGGTPSGTPTGTGIAKPLNLMGLTQNNQYEVYLQTNCGPGGTSDWSPAINFTTSCGIQTAPYFTSFEDGGVLNNCWTNETVTDVLDWTALSGATPSTATGPSVALNGTYYLYVETSGSTNGDTAVLYSPSIDLSALTTPRLSFYLHMFGLGMDPDGNVDVAVSNDAGASYTSVFNQAGNQGDVWNNILVDLSAYTGNTVIFRVTGTSSTTGTTFENDFAIDAFSVEETPTCFAPLNLLSVKTGPTTADLSWDATVGAVNYEYEYIDVTASETFTGVADGTVADPTVMASITGLTAGNDYAFKVRTDCGAGFSTWSLQYDWNQTPLPTCVVLVSPLDGATDVVGGITPLFWTENNPIDATGYDIYFGQNSGALPNLGNIPSAGTPGADMGINITSILAGTTYYWSIVPVNAGGSAQGCVEYSFTTAIAPTAPVGVTCTVDPAFNAFTEEFDVQGLWTGDIGAGNDLWNFGQSGATGSGTTGPSAAHSGVNYMYFEASGANSSVASAISPAIDLTSATEGAELSFFMHAYGVGIGRLDIFVSIDGGANYTYEDSWGGQLQTADTDAWVPVGVNLDAYTGQTINILLQYSSTTQFTGDMAIDLFEVNTCQTVSCPAPINLAVTDINSTNVDLSWDDVIEATTGFNWEIQPGAAAQGTIGTINSGTTGIGVTTVIDVAGPFTPGADYTLYVQADCGAPDISFWSSVSFSVSFGVDVCGLYSNSPALPIPDSDPNGATDSMMINDALPGTVLTDLDIYVDITHTFLGDLTITLTSPSGTSVELMSGTCGSDEDMAIIFDDEGVDGAIVCASPTQGIYFPQNALTAFDGESWNGDWSLTVTDGAGGDTGTINQWCLSPTFGTAAGTGTCAGGATKTWEDLGFGPAWTGGAPGPLDVAIIAGLYDTTAGDPSLDVCRLFVNFGHSVVIGSGTYIQTNGGNEINGDIFVLAGGSFVNLDATASTVNNGLVVVRTTTTNVGVTGFSILGSPMTMDTRANGFGNSFRVRSHNTTAFVPHPDVAAQDPTAENFADDNGDNWTDYSGLLNPGEGYLVFSADPNIDTNIISDFNLGTFNNGNIVMPTIFQTDQNSSPNILANPYPSAIDADALIGDAANTDLGAIYFWEHITLPGTASYPGYSSNNYDMGDISVRNLGGGTAAANGGTAPGQFIASGQGFGIKPASGTSGSVTFSNSIRVTGNNTGLRSSESIERLRLSVKNDTYGLSSNALVAFTDNATNGYDPKYDALRMATPISIFSVNSDRELVIQGRTAFNLDQIVPIGFRTLVQEEQTYTIAVIEVEGEAINNAFVFLQDNLLNTLTNLTETDYTFTANEGNQSDRFVIVFADRQLGTSDANLSAISLYPNPTKNLLTVISPVSKVNNIVIHDIAGRTVAVYDFTNELDVTMDLTSFNSAVYFVEINTEDGSITKRVIRE